MTELASAYHSQGAAGFGASGSGYSFQKDAQAQEWARQQTLQQQRHSQFEQMQMARLQQQNNQNQPLFKRGQDNDRFYQQSLTGNNMAGYQNQVQMQVGGQAFQPIETKAPSMVNNYGQKVQASTYDPSLFQKLNPGGPRSDIDFKSMTPDNFTRFQLFFLKSSPYCKNFLHLLCQSPELDKEIQKVDIDELRQNGHQVEGLKGVPTVIDGQNVYLGNQALTWLAEKTSNRISGFSLDDEGYSPIDQSSSQTAWSETAISGNNFSYVFEDNQVTDFDVRSIQAPQNATGRAAGNSMDQELKRLQMMRDQQIQVVRQGGAPSQRPNFQQQQPMMQGGGQGGRYTQGTPAPQYNPQGANYIPPSNGSSTRGTSGMQPSFGGQQASYGGHPGFSQSGYPQQSSQQGGGGPQLPPALQSQDPRGSLGPYQNRNLRR